MDKIFYQKANIFEKISFCCLALLGCCIIALGSLVKIPFYPVPFTMQTFAISLLALTQRPYLAFASAACYLLFGSLGAPVFAGYANPAWLTGKCAGYLLAFPLAAYCSSTLARRYNPFIALNAGQLIIYLFGFLGLTLYFHFSTAWIRGIVFFIPADLLKNMLAFSAAKWWFSRRNL